MADEIEKAGKKERGFWDGLDPFLARYFRERFPSPTETQKKAFEALRQGSDILVVSPTGSGKTFTAFMTVLDNLIKEAREGALQPRTYCIYVSPLKALGNDIKKNLLEPLKSVYKFAEEEGVKLQEIKISIRTGDTLLSERQKALRRPPHILITTPESLVLLLSSSHRKYLKSASYVVIDELHSLMPSKRGTMLSIALEWLDKLSERRPIRIGLSATISSPRKALRFLLGYHGSRWKFGELIEGGIEKRYTFEVRYTPTWEDLLKEIGEVINSHRVSIIFTGARRQAEEISYYLKGMGFTDLYPHHGSLSREVREEVETLLKKGELKAVVTSTSLELGIDIGEVDVVVQVSSPLSPSTLLQRVGRAGHGIGKVSKGIIMARTPHELLEVSAILEMAKRGRLEEITVPEEPWDVAIQMITGMAMGGVDHLKDIYEVLKNSYPFRRLKFSRLKAVVEDLSALSTFSPSLLNRFDLLESGRRVRVKRGFHHIFYTNVGTIVPGIKYSVYTSSPSKKVGELSGDFVERLSRYDVFMLGGRTYQFLEMKRRRIVVREVKGLLAMAPRWTGEVPTRPREVAEALSGVLHLLNDRIERVLEGEGEGGERWKPLLEEIVRRFSFTKEAAEELFHYILSLYNQRAIPLADRVIYERVGSSHRGSFALYHPSTLPVMKALAHILRFIYRRGYGYLARTTSSDDGILVTLPAGLPSPLDLMKKGEELKSVLREDLMQEEAYSIKLREVLFRSQFLIKSYKGRSVGPRKIMRDFMNLKALVEQGALKELGKVIKEEAEKEVLSRTYDVEGALALIDGVRSSAIKLVEAKPPTPLLREVFSFIVEEMESPGPTPRVEKKSLRSEEMEVDGETIKKLAEDFLSALELGKPPPPLNIPLSVIESNTQLKEMLRSLVLSLKKEGKVLKALPLNDSFVILPPGLEGIWCAAFKGKKGDEASKIASDLGFLLATSRRGLIEHSEVEEAIRLAITSYVERHSPLRESTLRVYLPLEGDELSRALAELEEDGDLYVVDLPGGERAFTLPGKKDVAIEGAIPLKDLNRYRFYRAERGIEDLQDYVERFWGFHSPYEVILRLSDIEPSSLIDRLRGGEFIPVAWGGLTVYTHRSKVGEIIALKGYTPLGPLHRRALRVLEVKRISSHWELGRHLKIPSKKAEEILTLLQEAGLVTKPDAFYRELTACKGYLKPLLPMTDFGGQLFGEEKMDEIAQEALLEVLNNLGPLAEKELSSLLGIDSGRVRVLLDRLLAKNRVEMAMVEAGGIYPVYGPPGWRKEMKSIDVKDRCRAYLGTDPLLRAYHTYRPRGYLEFPISVVRGGEIVGHLNLEVRVDGVHTRSLDIYDLNLLDEIVDSFKEPLKYHEASMLLIATIQKALGLEGDEIYPPLKRKLEEMGFRLYGKTWAKGPVAGEITEEELKLEIPSILRKQRLLKPYHVRSPVELLLIWGNIRDDWEILSRLGSVYFEGVAPPSAMAAVDAAGKRLIEAATLIITDPQKAKRLLTSPLPEIKYTGRTRVFYTVKEMAREYGLLKGYFFPGYQAWGSIHHALLYRSAFGKDLEREERGLLKVFPANGGLSLQEIRARSTLSAREVKDVIERLMKAGYLYRDTYGRYIRLREENIPREGAMTVLLLNEILHLNPFRMERLKGYLGPSVSSYSIRRALWTAVKLDLLRAYVGEEGILWASTEEGAPQGGEQMVIISPRDRLFNYFRKDIKALFGDDYLYPVFLGGELMAAVKMRKRGSEIKDVKLLGSGKVSLSDVMARMRDYMFRV